MSEPRAGTAQPGTPPPACPFCGSDQTELISLFGSSPLTSQYHCRACRSAFEQVKWGTLPAKLPAVTKSTRDS